jgi:hypothetical protein
MADTGTKMIHLGKNTRSRIISKGISAGKADQTYRGLVRIGPRAEGARNYTQCDSLLIGDQCGAHTVPYIESKNPQATEAATAALDWHFGNAANTEIVSGHFEGNAASRHVLEKLGFVETGLSMTPSAAYGKDVPHVDMLLTREAWLASH